MLILDLKDRYIYKLNITTIIRKHQLTVRKHTAIIITKVVQLRFVGDGHGHKVFVADLDDSVQIRISGFKGVGE